ncbi:MAG: hypothetical protein ACI4QA_05000 [Candidatus Spyradosoma sp.]
MNDATGKKTRRATPTEIEPYDDEAPPPARTHRQAGKLSLVDRQLAVFLADEGVSRNEFRNAALLVSSRVALLRVNRSRAFLFDLDDPALRRAARRSGSTTVYFENWETLAVPVRRTCGLPRACASGGAEDDDAFADL